MIKYVTRVYEINVPDEGTQAYADVNAAIDQANGPEDAAIIKSSPEAVATFLTYQVDGGNFTELMTNYDSTVKDTPPDIEEFELSE